MKNNSMLTKDFIFRKDLIFIFLLVVIAPFCTFVHLEPLGGFWSTFIAGVSVAIGFMVVLIGVIKERAVFLSRFVNITVTFFIFLCVLCLLQTTHWADRYTLFLYTAIVGMTALSALQLAQKSKTQYYEYLAFFLFLGGVIESLGAIAIQYRLAGIDYWMVPMTGRLIGFIAQSNQLAIYVMVAFLALCYLTLQRRFHITVLIIFSILFGFVLLGSGSRAVLLYIVTTAVAAVFCFLKTKDRQFIVLLWGLAALIIGAVLYNYVDTLIHWFNPTASLPTVDVAAALSRSSTSDTFRLSQIRLCFDLLMSSPLLGIGFGNYGVTAFWAMVNDPSYIMSGDLTLHSHNFITQIMAEFGLLGLAALLGLLAYVARCFYKVEKGIRWWFVCSVFSVFLINSLLEYVLWRIEFAVVLMLVLAPMLSSLYRQNTPRVLGVTLLSCVAVISYLMANALLDDYAKSFFYSNGVEVANPIDYAKYKEAASSALWGRKIQLQEISSSAINVVNIERTERLVDEALAWHPFAIVIFNKLQLLVLANNTQSIKPLALALNRAYSQNVPQICSYFNNMQPKAGKQALRMVQKELNCRALLSTKQQE